MAGLITFLNLGDKKIRFKELKLRDYKTILKCFVGDSPDIQNTVYNINRIVKKITNLDGESILNLNIYEYLLLLTHIRSMSLGNVIFATYKQDNAPLNIQILLDNTITELQQCVLATKPITLTEENVTLTYNVPTVRHLIEGTSPLEAFVDEKLVSIDDLSVKFVHLVNNIIKEFNDQVKRFYFFKAPVEKYAVQLTASIPEYVQLIKILLNENLLSVYENIFYLSKICHLSPEYLENCTYGEFKIFVKKTEELLQTTIAPPQETVVQEPPEDYFEPVDINSLYGNEEPQVSRSEFTP